MNKIMQGVLCLSSLLLAANLFAAEAYIVTHDRAVALVNHTGGMTRISESGFALDVSYSADGTVWVLTTDAGEQAVGGNRMAYYANGKWHMVTTSNGKEATAVSADKQGNVWFIDGDGRSIWKADRSGKVAYSLGGGKFVSVSVEGGGQYIWAIKGVPGLLGNPVMYHKIGRGGEWVTVKEVTGTNLSGGWVVTHDEKIVSVFPGASVTAYSSSALEARDVSIGPSVRVWAVTHAPHPNGGSVLKVLKKGGSGDADWKTVPDIGARRVSAK